MNKRPEEIYENSILKWRNKGQGIIIYDESLDLFIPALMILEKMLNKNINTKVVIVLPNNNYFDVFTTKLVSSKIFTHFETINNNIKVYTQNNLDTLDYDITFDLLVLIKAEYILYNHNENVLKIQTKYALLLSNDNGISKYTSLPIVDSVLKVDVFVKNISTSVIEYNYGLNMSENDKELYNRMNAFIQDTITIFNGDIDLVFKSYSGGKEKDERGNEIGEFYSGDHFRQKISEANGWSKDIDLSIEYNQAIDRYYNPNALFERCKTFNNIINERKKLLTDNSIKLESVLNIVNIAKNKKILIISKRSEFAIQITNFINENIPINIETNVFNYGIISNTYLHPTTCMNFNNDIETILIKDGDDYVRTKSGAIKKLGATSQNKIVNDLFNSNIINIISSNDSIPNYGNFTIDMVIFTSPECKDIHKLKYRLNGLKFTGKTIIVNMFLFGTKEEESLLNRQSLNKNLVENFNKFTDNIW